MSLSNKISKPSASELYDLTHHDWYCPGGSTAFALVRREGEGRLLRRTTVIGHLVGRMLADPIVAGRQTLTRKWWPTATQTYRLIVSRLVVEECSAGDPIAAAERLAVLNSMALLDASEAANNLAGQLVAGLAIPTTEPRDAGHIALAAVNGIEYLVTWNFKHIANPKTRSLIESICQDAGCFVPIICTPDELFPEE